MTIQLIQKTPDFSKFRPNAGAIIINEYGQILFCKRADVKDVWQMPQGGIDYGEAPAKAVLRELLEETGINTVSIKGAYPDWLVYKFIEGMRRDHFIGQAQKWFLLEFTGDPNGIDLSQVADQEFSEYSWVTPEHILGNVAPFKREVYVEAYKYFGIIR